jgi:hypothetical protein
MAVMDDDEDQIADEWLAEFRPDRLCDFTQLIEDGYLTVAQCAALAVVTLKGERHELTTPSYLAMAMTDIARQKLNPKHPQMLIRYSDILQMMSDGIYGPDGELMPLPNGDWLVTLDEAEQWLASKGRDIDLTLLRASLEEERLAKAGNPALPVAKTRTIPVAIQRGDALRHEILEIIKAMQAARETVTPHTVIKRLKPSIDDGGVIVGVKEAALYYLKKPSAHEASVMEIKALIQKIQRLIRGLMAH